MRNIKTKDNHLIKEVFDQLDKPGRAVSVPRALAEKIGLFEESALTEEDVDSLEVGDEEKHR